jgi:hypothetical protein
VVGSTAAQFVVPKGMLAMRMREPQRSMVPVRRILRCSSSTP